MKMEEKIVYNIVVAENRVHGAVIAPVAVLANKRVYQILMGS